MRRSPSNLSTSDPAPAPLAVGALVLTVVAACTSGASPTTLEESTVTSPPSTTSSTAAPETTLPAPTGTEVEVVESCEADPDQQIVASNVVPIGGEMAVAEGRVWISSLAAGGLVPVDTSTLCPRDPVTIANAAFGVTSIAVAGDGTLYVSAARTGGLAAIDPADESVATLAPGVDGGGGVAVSDGLLWAVCCDSERDLGAGAVIDLASGEVVAELPIEAAAVEIDVVGDTAWIGRRDRAGVYRVTWSDGELEVDDFDAFGAYTVDVTASEDGVWIVTDEPVIQQFVDGEFRESTVLPFPRERVTDVEVDSEGGVWAVNAFGPGIVWLRSDGVAFNALGAENLIQVEVTDERVWALTTDGALVRLNRGVLDG